MKKFLLVSLFIMSSPFYASTMTELAALAHALTNQKPTTQKTTFLVYMAAVNNLKNFIEDDLGEMQQVGSTDKLNLLVYCNTQLPDDTKVTQKLEVHKGSIKQYGEDKVKDSGDPNTVINACKWAIKHYPADQFVLVFWDHGSGSLNRFRTPLMPLRSVCYDDVTGNYLTDQKMIQALKEVVKLLGKKIDIVAFDACLMADIEIAYALKNYANFMVASQETIPGTGYGYDRALQQLSQTVLKPSDLAKIMVQAYQQEYINLTKKYTLSAIDLSKINPLVENTNRIAECLKRICAENYKTAFKTINACTISTLQFDNKYLDMIDFYQNLLAKLHSITPNNGRQKELQNLLQDGIKLIEQCVIDCVRGKLYAKSHGLSIYFDKSHLDRTYATTLWGQETKWIAFLNTFHGKR